MPPCRAIAATFGSFLPPLTYSVCRKLSLSEAASFTVGCLVLFDLLNIIEARHILVDSQLMFYCALSLWLALKYWDRLNTVRVRCMRVDAVHNARRGV
jgi:dolichyl-phosphate-mannose--protein O-mannosyl transferase